MTTLSGTTPSNRARTLRGILSRSAQVLFVLVMEALILFLAAGRMDWLWAWVLIAIWVASVAVAATLLLRTRPETIAERGTAPLTHTWDKVIAAVWSLTQYLLVPLLAGLGLRFAWPGQVAVAWNIAGALLMALGLGIFDWAMITNAYFSTAVRIQTERGHAVCTDGPYRFVRHPGYVGSVLQCVGAPLLLGSWWAMIPGVAAVGCIVARTWFEDRTLQTELPGYSDYARQVRFRLIPGIW